MLFWAWEGLHGPVLGLRRKGCGVWERERRHRTTASKWPGTGKIVTTREETARGTEQHQTVRHGEKRHGISHSSNKHGDGLDVAGASEIVGNMMHRHRWSLVVQSPKNCLGELGTSTARNKPVKLLRAHKKHGENLRL